MPREPDHGPSLAETHFSGNLAPTRVWARNPRPESGPCHLRLFNSSVRTRQQLNLGAGCLASVAQEGCGSARALEGASALVVSPDNLHVYVASAARGNPNPARLAPEARVAVRQVLGAAAVEDLEFVAGVGGEEVGYVAQSFREGRGG